MALPLANVWNLETDGHVIVVGLGGGMRPTAGLKAKQERATVGSTVALGD